MRVAGGAGGGGGVCLWFAWACLMGRWHGVVCIGWGYRINPARFWYRLAHTNPVGVRGWVRCGCFSGGSTGTGRGCIGRSGSILRNLLAL